jgi:hypothetical protein
VTIPVDVGEAGSARTIFSPAFHASIFRIRRQEDDRHFLAVRVQEDLEGLLRSEPGEAHGNNNSKNITKF